jgi:hypothetical protein
MIPAFDANGNLPPGVHVADWREFEVRYGDTPHRRRLIAGLAAALAILRLAGCKRVYVDGSFVTEKDVPNDYDAAWDPAGVDVALLLAAEPVFGQFDNLRAAQKAKFLGEFFPSSVTEGTVGKTFLDFFQIDRNTGNAKGIIALDL